MIHIQKAGELRRDTETLCGMRTEGIGRKDGFVEFKNSRLCDCEQCNEIVRKTELMRKIIGPVWKKEYGIPAD